MRTIQRISSRTQATHEVGGWFAFKLRGGDACLNWIVSFPIFIAGENDAPLSATIRGFYMSWRASFNSATWRPRTYQCLS